ncbi:MAG: hypothetical protein GC185_10595 [Alphaproteobacteria bacterium]|nr:hypothetical protein [Alphaproteobacteria bacterium]
MQFVIIAKDHADAAPRRKEARQAHLDGIAALKAEGKMLYAAALLNDAGEMNGSMIVCDFADNAALEAWLQKEPYVTTRVWGDIDIKPCKPAAPFAEAKAA